MARSRKKRWVIVFAIFLAMVCFGLYAYWRLIRHSIPVATADQVRPYIPKEITDPNPPDQAAVNRFAKLLRIITSLKRELPKFSYITKNSSSTDQKADSKTPDENPDPKDVELARRFISRHGRELGEIEATLRQGPIFWDNTSFLFDDSKLAQPTLIQKTLSQCALLLAETGDGGTAVHPLAIANLLAQITLIDMKNAVMPPTKFDNSALELGRRVAAGLPDPGPNGPNGLWDQIKGLVAMNSGSNTIGRQYVGLHAQGFDVQMLDFSCKWRAMRNATRVLLAAKLYETSHGGQLPPDTAGFLPLLGAWPQDPFTGKPMIYNRQKRVVYAVGPNLKDDGGLVEGKTPLDVGVSLP